MSKLKYIDGNILYLDKSFELIAHGCNCFCNFGAGLAKEIKLKHPEAYKADLDTVKGDKKKL